MNENIELLIIGDLEHIVIDRGNGEFTSIPKFVWDAQQDAETL